ncbi:3-oxo-5a-steroid 4- dehydrogenase, partial [Cladochytrium tenue]
PKWNQNRQRLTYARAGGAEPPAVLERGKRLKADYGVTDGDTVTFKDLGPQIAWRTVFVLEYLGPLVIHPALFFLPEVFYGAPAPRRSTLQIIALVMVLVHYLKREFETLFVHRFSLDTMPLRNLPKNCFHYWITGGVLLAYPIYQPNFEGGLLGGVKGDLLYPLIGLFVYAEVSNLITHLILADLRPPGSKVRKIPFGYGFNYVSCPNYFYESMAWLLYAVITGSVAAYLFFAVGAGQMYLWAVKKHKRYLREFGDKYPKNRTAIVPFLL